MSIEYTYPEPQRPTGAKVATGNRLYEFESTASDTINFKGWIDFRDVPEVCEAMMRLAGHEWPGGGGIASAVRQELAERIIARLEHPENHRRALSTIEYCVSVIKDECGL